MIEGGECQSSLGNFSTFLQDQEKKILEQGVRGRLIVVNDYSTKALDFFFENVSFPATATANTHRNNCDASLDPTDVHLLSHSGAIWGKDWRLTTATGKW